MRPKRIRRSELSTPGSSEKMLEKAAASRADLVFLDLEDSVAPGEKANARATVIQALTELNWAAKTRAVRINDVNSEYGYEDIIEVVEQAGAAVDTIILPKVRGARDVLFVDTLLTAIETKRRWTRRIGLEVLIEEVDALIEVERISRCTPRIEALIFGPGDFAASQGIVTESIGTGDESLYPGDMWHYARNKIVVAARSAGLDAIDGPYAAFRDDEGYLREAVRSRTLGFVGKWAIHPNQVGIANDVYAPTADRVERAKRLIAAYKAAEAEGLGAVAIDGDMVDAASVRTLREVVATAELIGL